MLAHNEVRQFNRPDIDTVVSLHIHLTEFFPKSETRYHRNQRARHPHPLPIVEHGIHEGAVFICGKVVNGKMGVTLFVGAINQALFTSRG
tara:strand:- start:144 stop:413 length:270 start_codon:yes stop_codon:yes gene_type:complete